MRKKDSLASKRKFVHTLTNSTTYLNQEQFLTPTSKKSTPKIDNIDTNKPDPMIDRIIKQEDTEQKDSHYY